MTTLQEAARKALACLELYDHEDLASCEARHELRTALAQQGEPVAWINSVYDIELNHKNWMDPDEWVPLYTAAPAPLAQQREQQPVCHGCGIPAGDVHMSTCKSGKWPSRVSNGDTDTPAPQPAQGESLNLAREVLKLNALWNKSTVQAPEISDQLGICRVLAERVNTDD